MHNGSDHTHTHAHAHAESLHEATTLLDYLLTHNKSHAEELHVLSHDVEEYGEAEASKLLHECASDFERANAKLHTALHMLKKE